MGRWVYAITGIVCFFLVCFEVLVLVAGLEQVMSTASIICMMLLNNLQENMYYTTVGDLTPRQAGAKQKAREVRAVVRG